MNTNELIRLAGTQTWQLAVLIAVVAAAVSTLARNRPHLAHVLWLLVLLKCFCPPLWSSPSGVFCWLQRADVAKQKVRQSTSFAASSFVLPDGNAESFDEASSDLIAPADPEAAAAATAVTVDPAQKPGEHPGPSVAQWLLGLWLGGAAVSLAWLAARWLLFAARLKRSPACEFPEVTARFGQLARALRVGQRVRLRVTDSRIGPAVIGLWHPTVLLPAVIVQGKSPAELEPILAHELIHIRRGDLWLSFAQALARSLWWFHLPLRWALCWAQREAERCCDEEVLAELRCEPAVYARSLLEVLDRKRWLWPVPAVPGVRPVEITSRRLERIMKLGHGGHRRTPWWCRALLLMLAALALPGGALVAAGDNPKSSSHTAAATATEAPVNEGASQSVSAVRSSEEPPLRPAGSGLAALSERLREVKYTVNLPSPAVIQDSDDGYHVSGGPWRIGFGEEQRRLSSESGKSTVPHAKRDGWLLELTGDVQLTFDELRATAQRADLHGSKLMLTGNVRWKDSEVELSANRVELTPGRIVLDGHVRLKYRLAGGSTRSVTADRIYWDLDRQHLRIMSLQEELYLGRTDRPKAFLDTRRDDLRVHEEVRLYDPTGPLADDTVAATANQQLPKAGAEKANPKGYQASERSRVYAVTYNVADLVVPMPAVSVDVAKSPVTVRRPDPPMPDFQPLMNLIQSTVCPGRWVKDGGAGSIAPFATNLSLVVSQTKEAHAQITELLEQLRRQLDTQVSLEARAIRPGDDGFWQRGKTGIDLTPEKARTLAVARLTTSRASLLLEAAQRDRQTSLLQAPKLTLLNHQEADLSLPLQNAAGQPVRLKLVSSVSDDRRNVHLRLSDSENTAHYQIPNGESLLVNLTEGLRTTLHDPAEKVGIPLLQNMPHVGRLFEGSATPANNERLFLLLTARILIQEEEEDLLLEPGR